MIKAGKKRCYAHDFEHFIDPKSGGWVRCKCCGAEYDCEDPECDEGGM